MILQPELQPQKVPQKQKLPELPPDDPDKETSRVGKKHPSALCGNNTEFSSFEIVYGNLYFRCLNSFDIKESPSSDSRVILYDKKSVRALDHHPQLTGEESEETLSSPVKKRRKGRKKKKAKKSTEGSRRLHDDSEVGCQSCDSIESSPTRYKDDMTWTGYKIKKRRTKSSKNLQEQDQKSD